MKVATLVFEEKDVFITGMEDWYFPSKISIQKIILKVKNDLKKENKKLLLNCFRLYNSEKNFKQKQVDYIINLNGKKLKKEK